MCNAAPEISSELRARYQRSKSPTNYLMSVQPAKVPDTVSELQAWFDDHQSFRWKQAKNILNQFIDGKINDQDWYELIDALLMEGHANSHWIGVVWGSGEYSEFQDSYAAIGRAIADVDADYLIAFADDLASGRYLDSNGDIQKAALQARLRLYLGKMRGTANDAALGQLEGETDVYWRLGGAEQHCQDCPYLAANWTPIKKRDMYASPGSCDTECLGNCLCYLEFVVSDELRTGPKAVTLELDES